MRSVCNMTWLADNPLIPFDIEIASQCLCKLEKMKSVTKHLEIESAMKYAIEAFINILIERTKVNIISNCDSKTIDEKIQSIQIMSKIKFLEYCYDILKM